MSLVLELRSVTPATLQAARALARAWRNLDAGRVRWRIGSQKDTPSSDADENVASASRAASEPALHAGNDADFRNTSVVRLAPCSCVSAAVSVVFQRAYQEPLLAAAELALTTAAWDGANEVEPWRLLAAPMRRFVHWGTPNPAQPWHVTSGAVWARHTARDHLVRQAVRCDAQLHVLGGLPSPAASNVVWWPLRPRVAAALLGHAARVIDDGPLAYDAVRAGVDVFQPNEPAFRERAAARRWFSMNHAQVLAGLVPATLLDDDELWEYVAHVARHLRFGAAASPLASSAWLLRGRERARAHDRAKMIGWRLIRRRYRKLRRDPRRFFADSRFGALRSVSALRDRTR